MAKPTSPLLPNPDQTVQKDLIYIIAGSHLNVGLTLLGKLNAIYNIA